MQSETGRTAPALSTPAAGPTVVDFTEAELIARVRAQLPKAPDWVALGIGDDACVVQPEKNRLEVLTVDALIEGVHFDRAFTPPAAIGHRALAVNLSDIAAMGAEPRLVLVSLALPQSLPVADYDHMMGGLAALAARYGAHVVGGNLTRSPGPMMVDITVTGTVKPRRALTRGGARPGHELYVTGTIGAASAGLEMLQSRVASISAPTDDDCIQRYLFPEPRVRSGLLLGRTRTASACIDLSDGLADAVRQLAGASGTGARIDAEALPIAAGARRWFQSRGADDVHAAVVGGDDYELLVAVPPRARRQLAGILGAAGPLTRIGVCTAEPDIIMHYPDGRALPLPTGYSHFR
jgi:thiamine-monophosphate kinase